jgi:hypothetical protein
MTASPSLVGVGREADEGGADRLRKETPDDPECDDEGQQSLDDSGVPTSIQFLTDGA